MDVRPRDWSEELAEIEALCRVPGMNASRLFRIMEQDNARAYFLGNKNQFNRDAAQGYGLRPYAGGGFPVRVAVTNNINTPVLAHLNNELIVPIVADLADESIDAVVELGCGYGRNLFALRDVVEHRFPRITYVGCDFSETGLDAGRKVAALEPNRQNIRFVPFNYFAPTFDFVKGRRKVLFFTCHSIEQVHDIGEPFFHALLAAAPDVLCVHAEPVGWQCNPEALREVRTGDIEKRDTFTTELLKPVDDFYTARVPAAHGWNRDLVSCLAALEQKKLIKADFVYRNACGNDVFNPSTLIQWRKVPAM